MAETHLRAVLQEGNKALGLHGGSHPGCQGNSPVAFWEGRQFWFLQVRDVSPTRTCTAIEPKPQEVHCPDPSLGNSVMQRK